MKYNLDRKIVVGGSTKECVLESLSANLIGTNDYASRLFSDEALVFSAIEYEVYVKSVTVSDLGFKTGALSGQIFRFGADKGLQLCPLELAIFLRLQYTTQVEGPYLTVASLKTRDDETYPNGFYLRNYDGKLWLRGYRATSDVMWAPECEFVFMSDECY